MPTPDELLASNRAWAERTRAEAPDLFDRLARQQTPRYLWIGCSDSRVPPSRILDLPPGELFVHRNIANLVVHTDLSCLSALQFAVEVLRVEHVIVCGHYGCGGVRAAAEGTPLGLIENWLRHVQDALAPHRAALAAIDDEVERLDRACELNAIDQVVAVCRTTIVRDAWERGQELAVHGWIYGLADGRLRDLGATVRRADEMNAVAAAAVERRLGAGRPAAD